MVKKTTLLVLPTAYVAVSVILATVAFVGYDQLRPAPPEETSEGEPEVTEIYIPHLGGKEGKVKVTLNCSIPEAPEKLPVLRVIGRRRSHDEGLWIAREIFNMTDPLAILVCTSEGANPDFTVVENRSHPGGRSITFYRTGAISTSSNGFGTRPTNLPSESEVREIADTFMEKILAYGLHPTHPAVTVEFSEVTVGGTSGTGNFFWINYYCASYATKFNGMRIGGVGIDVGDRGKIVGFDADWFEVEPDEEVPVTLTAIEAAKNLEIPLCQSRIEEFVVEKIELAYCTPQSLSVFPEKLLPGYRFTGTLIFGGGSTFHYYETIPAVEGDE